MQLAYLINLVIHALAGLAVLVALPIPLIAKKGGPAHRKAGWVFVAAMAVVSVTGLLIALSWATIPLTVKPPSGVATPEAIARAEHNYRAFALFFTTIAVLSASAVWHGMSALRLKQVEPDTWVRPVDHFAYLATIVTGAALLSLGLGVGQLLFSIFGAVALFSGLGDAHFVLRGRHQPKAWLVRHLQSMLGGATAALTAFSALTLRNYLGTDHAFAASAWLVPIVLGVGASWAWTRHYQRRPRPHAV